MNKEIGERIRKLREKRAWTQAQLAEISDLSERTVQRLEEGKPASLETLKALASAFDLDVQTLCEDDPSSTKKNEDVTKQVSQRYEIISLSKMNSGGDLLRLLISCDAVTFDYDAVDEGKRDGVAELHQDLYDIMLIKSDIEPIQQRNVEKDLQIKLQDLQESGVLLAGGSRVMRLKSKNGEEPFTMTVAHIIVSEEREPKLFALWDKTQPIRFS